MLEEIVEFSREQIKHLQCPLDINDFGPWVNQFNLYMYKDYD